MDRKALLGQLQKYESAYREERLFIPRFCSLLNNFPNCYHRSLTTGHMTGSAWIVDQKTKAVLLVHHKKLDRWLQPGGHADGHENILNVATREAEEETGLSSLSLFNREIFDIDIHMIPKYKNVPAHLHHDIRFLFLADQSEPVLSSEESHNVAWIPLDEVVFFAKNNRSIHRMIMKTKLIFN